MRVGLGRLHQGQQLVMTAPLDAVALARRITEHAYGAGASMVTTFFADAAASLLRYQLAANASFDASAGWLYDGMAARPTATARRAWQSPATTLTCCTARTRTKWHAPTAPARSPTARHWS